MGITLCKGDEWKEVKQKLWKFYFSNKNTIVFLKKKNCVNNGLKLNFYKKTKQVFFVKNETVFDGNKIKLLDEKNHLLTSSNKYI